MMDNFWRKKNILYFVLCFFVVCGHNSRLEFYDRNHIVINDAVRNIIAVLGNSFETGAAVSIFFFFSGLLLFRPLASGGGYLKRGCSHLKSLFLPYICWNVIGLLWAIFLENVPFLANNLTGDREHFSLSFSNMMRGILFYKYNPTFWYVFLLMFFILWTPLVEALIKDKYIGIVLIAVVLVLYQKGIAPYGFLGVRNDVLVYYLCGAFVGKHMFMQLVSKEFTKIELIGAVCVFTYLVFTQNFNASPLLLDSFISTFLLGSSLWVIISCLPAKLIDSKWFGFKISFFIYALHPFVEPCINKLVWILCPHTDFWALFNLVGGVLITLGIILVIAWIMRKNKYLNYIWALLNGGRVGE